MTGIASQLLCCCDTSGPEPPSTCANLWRNCPDEIYLDISTSTFTYASRYCFGGSPFNFRTDGPCDPDHPWPLPGHNCGCYGNFCELGFTEYRNIGTYSIQLFGLRMKKRSDVLVPGSTYRYYPVEGEEQTGSIFAEYLFIERKVKHEGVEDYRPCTFYDERRSFTHGALLRTEGPYIADFSGFVWTGSAYAEGKVWCQAFLGLGIRLRHLQGMEVFRESSADTSDPCHSRNWNGGPSTEYRPAEMLIGYQKKSSLRERDAPPICPVEWLSQPGTVETIQILHNLPQCTPFQGPDPLPYCYEVASPPLSPGTVQNNPWEPPCVGSTFQRTSSVEIGTPTLRYV